MREIGRELNVDALIEGTVMRSGDLVRISAKLINAKTSRLIWANTYDRDLRDVLALQGEVARAVAREISITGATSGADRGTASVLSARRKP